MCTVRVRVRVRDRVMVRAREWLRMDVQGQVCQAGGTRMYQNVPGCTRRDLQGGGLQHTERWIYKAGGSSTPSIGLILPFDPSSDLFLDSRVGLGAPWALLGRGYLIRVNFALWAALVEATLLEQSL